MFYKQYIGDMLVIAIVVSKSPGFQGVPWSIMLHDKFHGNEDAMKAAIACGDLTVTSYQGRDFLSFASLESGRLKELNDKMELDDGEHQLDEESHGVISNWIKNINFLGTGQGQGQVGDQVGPSGQDGVVVLKKTKEEEWKTVEKVVGQAKGAQEKLIRDSMKLKEKALGSGDQDLIGIFKESIQVLHINERNLDHILLWKDWGGYLI